MDECTFKPALYENGKIQIVQQLFNICNQTEGAAIADRSERDIEKTFFDSAKIGNFRKPEKNFPIIITVSKPCYTRRSPQTSAVLYMNSLHTAQSSICQP